MMDIKPRDLVLEVGSGDKPHPRSDVLLDKLPEDPSEREARRDLVIDRPLVIGDAEALPFADQSFDYIIALHVLEHAQDPAKFLEGLARVGKGGYIETPLPLRERVFNWSFHHWYVYQKGKTLALIKKTSKSKKSYAGMRLRKRKELYHLEGKKLLNLQFEWRGKIDYEVWESEPKEFLLELDQRLAGFLRAKETGGQDWLQELKSNLLLVPEIAKMREFTGLLRGRRRRKVDLSSLIVCPGCKGKLEVRKEGLECGVCGRKFPFYRRTIPVLLLQS